MMVICINPSTARIHNHYHTRQSPASPKKIHPLPNVFKNCYDDAIKEHYKFNTMKNITLTVLGLLLILFVIQGCEKARMADIGDGKIKATKTELSQFELDTLLFTGAATTDSVKWTVTPANQNVILIKANVAIIYFFKVGTYTVSAQKLSGGETQSISINVTPPKPPVFVPETGTTNTTVTTVISDTTQFEPITGDVNLGISFYRNPPDGKVEMNFSPQTVNTYCARGKLQYTAILDESQNFSLDLVNIREPKGCLGATIPNIKIGAGDVFKRKLISLGSHQFKVTLNGVVYNGSIVVNTSNITINWPYTTGVIMPPLVIPY
jgi:hypothetical protein